MYFSTSSAVIPKPLSLMVSVLAFLSRMISILASPNSVLASPIEMRCFNLEVASVPFDISSRKNIS